jgi:hypothetical protein
MRSGIQEGGRNIHPLEMNRTSKGIRTRHGANKATGQEDEWNAADFDEDNRKGSRSRFPPFKIIPFVV